MNRKIIALFLAAVLTAALSSAALAYPGESLGLPSGLDAATLNTAEVLTDADGVPFFRLEITFPQSFMDLNDERPAGGETWIDYYWKIGENSWSYIGGGTTDCIFDASYGCAVAGKTNTYIVSGIYPEDEGNAQEIVIKDHTYTIAAVLCYRVQDESGEMYYISSAFSNEISVGSGSFYQKVSDWAKSELQDAYDLGLVPDILADADMTKPVTREEFCEIAVLLYEKATGRTAEPVSPNPFTDTENPRILKAYKLGITTGTSASAFSPDVLINREQCAAMLFRAIKAMAPDADYSTAGVRDFPDQQYISAYAADAAKYMFRLGIISGDAQGNFMPRAVTSAQTAAGYGMATREQAVALSLRTYEAFQ